MRRLLAVHPLLPDRLGEHQQWCDQLRARRDDFERSRRRAGITRQIAWVQPSHHLAIVRTDAPDPVAALHHLARSDTAFDRRYAGCEQHLHGGPVLAPDAAVPELLADYHHQRIDPFDLFLVSAVPLLAGRTELFRRAVADSVTSGAGLRRVRRWGVKRLAVWLHPMARGDVVIYEAAGDIPELLRSMASDGDDEIAGQRAMMRQAFGIDVSTESYPMPQPAFAWSSDHAEVDL